MLKEIAIHLTLQVNQLKDNGLMSGKMGVLLYLYYYSRYAKNETFEWFADSILNNILDNLSINTPLEFYNGRYRQVRSATPPPPSSVLGA